MLSSMLHSLRSHMTALSQSELTHALQVCFKVLSKIQIPMAFMDMEAEAQTQLEEDAPDQVCVSVSLCLCVRARMCEREREREKKRQRQLQSQNNVRTFYLKLTFYSHTKLTFYSHTKLQRQNKIELAIICNTDYE